MQCELVNQEAEKFSPSGNSPDLQSAGLTKRVSPRAAKRIIQDGPFAETKEVLGSCVVPPPAPVSTFLRAWGIHEHQT
jgi:hypothetical protein